MFGELFALVPLIFIDYDSLEKGQGVNLSVFKMGVGRKVTCNETIIKILRDFCLNEGGRSSPTDSLKLWFQGGE